MKFANLRPTVPPGFNLTPMVDVVLLLIIFWMTVTSLAQQSAQLAEVPRELVGRFRGPALTVRLRDTEPFSIRVLGVRIRDQQFAQLLSELKSAGKLPERLVLQADHDCEASRVVNFAELATAAGVRNIDFAVRTVPRTATGKR